MVEVCGVSGVVEARSKEVKLRMLDVVRAGDESVKWQLINVALPVVLLLVFGVLFNFWRKRKYTGGTGNPPAV